MLAFTICTITSLAITQMSLVKKTLAFAIKKETTAKSFAHVLLTVETASADAIAKANATPIVRNQSKVALELRFSLPLLCRQT